MTDNSALVGRTPERVRIGDLIDDLARGRGHGLFVLGASGAGKTRLLTEAASLATANGVRVARAMCLPVTRQLSFDPALDLLRSLGAAVPPALVGGSTQELFGLMVRRIEEASVAGPLLLCLDDLHWSDAATVDLVQYCRARLDDLPIAWLLAARSGRSAGRIVYRLQRDGLVDTLELGPLSGAETRQLAELMLGSEVVEEELVKAVHERAGGNPFFSAELLRAVSPSDGAGTQRAGDRLSSALVPATVSDAIEERAARLSPQARTALDWAAVLPERFTFRHLEAVGGAELGVAPEELADAGFLVAEPDGCWSFAHAIIHDAVYRRLPEAERVRRHGVVVTALSDLPLEQRAPQLERAERFGEAAAAYEELGQRSLNRGRGDDAVRLYERAARHAAAGGDARARRRANAGRVLALVRDGARDQAREAAAGMHAELREADDLDERLRFIGEFAYAVMSVVDATDLETAREVLAEAEPLVDQASGPAVAVVLSAQAWFLLRTGETTRALGIAERAVELAATAEDPVLEARALNALGLALGMSQSAPHGMTVLERARDVGLAAGLAAEAGRACLSLSFLAEHAREIAAIEVHSRRGLAIDGLPPGLRGSLHSNNGMAHLLAGDLDGAMAHLLAAVNEAAKAGPASERRVVAGLVYVHLWRGELAAARRTLEDQRSALESFGDTRLHELWGLLLEAEDRPHDALARFRIGAQLEDPISVFCETGAVRTAVVAGELDSARASLQRLDELVARWPVGEWMREEARAWIATAEHYLPEAISHFRAAATGCSSSLDSARLRLEAARLSADRPELLGALQDFDRMGAVRLANRARAIARQLGMRPGRRRNRSGLLSAREQEIAQLVAAGHTNAEIAQKLFLSPRTVERHVANILSKLGYRSRVQIAADAAAGRLAGAAVAEAR